MGRAVAQLKPTAAGFGGAVRPGPPCSRLGWRAAAVLLLTLACGPVPGGSLRGEAAAVPVDWRVTSSRSPTASDGQASLARGGCSILADAQEPGCEPRPEVEFTFVGSDVVSDLERALRRAGAARLRGGQPGVLVDAPLHTVTFLGSRRGRDRDHAARAAVVSKANTFSFFDPMDPGVCRIVGILEEFIAAHFARLSAGE